MNFEKLAGMGARQLETDSEVDSFEERYMGSNLGDGSSGNEGEAGLPSLETPKNDESLAQLTVAGQQRSALMDRRLKEKRRQTVVA